MLGPALFGVADASGLPKTPPRRERSNDAAAETPLTPPGRRGSGDPRRKRWGGSEIRGAALVKDAPAAWDASTTCASTTWDASSACDASTAWDASSACVGGLLTPNVPERAERFRDSVMAALRSRRSPGPELVEGPPRWGALQRRCRGGAPRPSGTPGVRRPAAQEVGRVREPPTQVRGPRNVVAALRYANHGTRQPPKWQARHPADAKMTSPFRDRWRFRNGLVVLASVRSGIPLSVLFAEGTLTRHPRKSETRIPKSEIPCYSSSHSTLVTARG